VEEGALLPLETGMATDLETRPTTSKSEAYLQRKFADLCARIKRVDLTAHLLALSLAVLWYALFVGLFDSFAGNSTAIAVSATRWIGFGAFACLVGFLLVQTGRCAVRPVNPYFVAHQLEATLPDAKNSLINWLDLQDEPIPSAFQKTLSARAAEHFEECDQDQPIKKRKNWIMLGSLVVPMLGLIVVAILNPPAFGPSMMRAFAPFYTPAPIARTRITDVQPGDAEVIPTQPIAFAARIEGRVPSGNRPEAPTLSYRYHADEDYLTQPLQSDGAETWTTSLLPAQIRTGFTYKISAGDAETPEYQVRVRTRTHVAKFALTYQHPPYRKLPTGPFVFPNDKETKPIIRGPRGSEVEVVIHASRPMQKPRVEIALANIKTIAELSKVAEDAFSFQMKLTQSGQFRVLFTSTDGEENGDRDWYTIDVVDDDAPKIVLKTPGKDVQVAENGTLVIEGLATSGVGLKNLTLHLRDATTSAPILPRVYRPEVSFRLDDGAYPGEIAYLDVLDLKQLKTSKDTAIFFAPGTVIEYWLEATDCSDYQKPVGNVGKSSIYKITLTPKAKDDDVQRKAALDQKSKHDKKQDADLSKQKKEGKQQNQSGNGAGQPNPQEQLSAAQKEKDVLQKKLQAATEKDKQPGASKGPPSPSAETKPEPSKSPDDPQPQKKESGAMSDDAGKSKQQGDGATGAAKNDGEKSKGDGSQGERKDGPKDTGSSAKADGPTKDQPAGGTKAARPNGMNSPIPGEPKEPTPNDVGPMPTAKADKGNGQSHASAKGIEQNGPTPPNKDQTPQDTPPNGQAKTGTMNDADGDSKKGPPAQAPQPGSARGSDSTTPSPERSLENLANKLDQLPHNDAAADKIGKAVADIAKNSDDPRKRDLAQEILKANGRDPKTGEKMKGKNPFGSGGQSPGISDELKTTIANREFAARIGQLQLDDWKKRMTPDLLKKAGMTDADWQRYLKAAQSYDALVRQLNAQQLKDARQKAVRAANPGSVRDIDTSTTNSNPLDAIRGSYPPEIRDAIERYSTRKSNKD
jgi:hypothetical protein